jgi:hypothetical protein
MQLRTVVIGTVLVAAVLVGTLALRGRDEAKPGTDVPPVTQPEAPPAPTRRSDTPKAASPAVKTESASRSPATESYETSSNLRALADGLGDRLEKGDAEATRTMARILDECFQAIIFPNYFASFRSNLANIPPEQRSTALMHIGRVEQRCADIARTEKVTSSRLRDLQRRGIQGDDLVALAHRVADDPASLSGPERADAVRRIITSRHGEAIHVLADAMEFSDEMDNPLLRLHAGQRSDVYAWKLVGCAFGAPCGPDSSIVRHYCLVFNNCMPGGYREYVRYYVLSPYNYDAAISAEKDILQIISSGRTEELLF